MRKSPEEVQQFLTEYYDLCKKHGLEIDTDMCGSTIIEEISIMTKGFGFHFNCGEYYLEHLK